MQNSNIFKLNVKDVAGAVVSAVIVSLIGYVLKVGDVFALDVHTIVNTAVMTGLASLLKSLTTDSDGYLLGVLKVK